MIYFDKSGPDTTDGWNGLNTKQAEESQKMYGDNSITQTKKKSFFRQFLSNFGDPIIKILLSARALNVLFTFRHFDWFESMGIAFAIFLATFVSTFSEFSSEAAFEQLQEDAGKITCRVRREGKLILLPINEIVVGDIVLLQSGERIPADGIILQGELNVDQSALNGESLECKKRPASAETEQWDLMSKHQLFRGSVVSNGDGIMQVVKVGNGTFYGAMAKDMQEDTRQSPLKLRLENLANSISKLGYIGAGLVALADLFHSIVMDCGFQLPLIMEKLTTPAALFSSLLHAMTLAITVVVVAVPEGLPMMITVVLSANMRRMLKDNVLVRKLVGIETSGSLNILFTDKTGTLTKGQLSVAHFIKGDGKEYRSKEDFQRKAKPLYDIFELGSYFNTGSAVSAEQAVGGNATDRALLSYVLPVREGVKRYQKLKVVPFDSARKFSSVHIKGEKEYILIKGAPEKILPNVSRYYDEAGKVCSLTNRSILRKKWNEMANQAIRVLAVAVSEKKITEEGNFENLILVGLVGIRDEIRPEVRSAVRQVREAGVQVIMITGDNKETAAAIAKEAELLGYHDGSILLTSAELSQLSDTQLKEMLPKICVIARAVPTDKSRLVRIAQEMDLVVGMTGDGINDAPALKRADVGFAMGSGTEVAKEASDIVIVDNNFASIVKAILYGRTIFKSIRKFIVFQLTMNLCAVGVSMIGPFIGIDSPVTIVQMLWINMIMDTLGGLAFAGEPPLSEYMNEKPKRRDEPILNGYMLNQIGVMTAFILTLCILFLKCGFVKDYFHYAENDIYFLTAFFTFFIFLSIFNCFNVRTTRVKIFSNLWQNKIFLVIMCGVLFAQLLFVYFGGELFRTIPLPLRELKIVIFCALIVFPADMIRKAVLKISRKNCSV